jgi:hypothetical protein
VSITLFCVLCRLLTYPQSILSYHFDLLPNLLFTFVM